MLPDSALLRSRIDGLEPSNQSQIKTPLFISSLHQVFHYSNKEFADKLTLYFLTNSLEVLPADGPSLMPRTWVPGVFSKQLSLRAVGDLSRFSLAIWTLLQRSPYFTKWSMLPLIKTMFPSSLPILSAQFHLPPSETNIRGCLWDIREPQE